MHFGEIESNTEIALIVEELEALASRVEELKTEELKERALRGEVVFVRPAKIRALVYERFELYNHFEARKFTRKFATNAKKLEYYVASIVNKVCEYFKQYNLYRRPVPKEFVERVVDYYANVVIANRRIYVITKNYSKRKKVRTPQGSKFVQTQLRGSSPQGRDPRPHGLGREGLGMKGSR